MWSPEVACVSLSVRRKMKTEILFKERRKMGTWQRHSFKCGIFVGIQIRCYRKKPVGNCLTRGCAQKIQKNKFTYSILERWHFFFFVVDMINSSTIAAKCFPDLWTLTSHDNVADCVPQWCQRLQLARMMRRPQRVLGFVLLMELIIIMQFKEANWMFTMVEKPRLSLGQVCPCC